MDLKFKSHNLILLPFQFFNIKNCKYLQNCMELSGSTVQLLNE